MSAHIFTPTNILTILVEEDFDETFVIRMMNNAPGGSLFHSIYDCLYAEAPVPESEGAFEISSGDPSPVIS